jgi:hypothetical protein
VTPSIISEHPPNTIFEHYRCINLLGAVVWFDKNVPTLLKNLLVPCTRYRGGENEYRSFLKNARTCLPKVHGVTFKKTVIIAVREDIGVISTYTSESTQLLLTRDDK